jgi:hypothetical protein
VKHFAQLAKQLIQESNAKLVLFGTKEEQRLSQEFLKILSANGESPSLGAENSKMTDMTGKTTLSGLAAALKKCDLLVTGDTGTMHLAAHYGTPVLALFLGPAWCHETGPYGLGHWVIQTAPPCAPCLESQAICPEASCQELIRPEFVSVIVRRMLGESLPLPVVASSVRVYHSELDRWGLKYLPEKEIDHDSCLQDEEELQAILYRELGRKVANPVYEMDMEGISNEIQNGYGFDPNWLREKIEWIRKEGSSLICRRMEKRPPLPADYGGESAPFFGLFEEWLTHETLDHLKWMEGMRKIIRLGTPYAPLSEKSETDGRIR